MVQSSWVGPSLKEIEAMVDQKVSAKLGEYFKKFDDYIKEDQKFKHKLVLLLSQMRERQEISQEAFDKLNAPLQDFIAGDSVDLDSF